MWHCANVRFTDTIFFFLICGFVICEIAICGPKLFYGLKFSASPRIHTFSLDIAVRSNSNLNKVRKFQQNKQDPFHTELCSILYKYVCGLIMKICRFFASLLAYLRNLRICDSGISPRSCGFADFEKGLPVHPSDFFWNVFKISIFIFFLTSPK